MPQKVIPAMGADVSALMPATPPDLGVGADVSALMTTKTPTVVSPAEPGTFLEGALRHLAEQARQASDWWVNAGPRTMVQGGKDLLSGDISRGIHEMAMGTVRGLAPFNIPLLVRTAVLNPAATIGAVVGGGAGQFALQRGAAMLGASPDQATLAGDIGAVAGGGVGAGLGQTTGRVTLQAAQRAAEGAQEGGIGGAVAATVRTVAPRESKVLLTQALKPRSTHVRFPAAVDTAMPEIKAAEQLTGQPVKGLDDLLGTIRVAKQEIQTQLNTLRGPAQAMGTTVDLSPVADSMVASIPYKTALETPTVAKQLIGQADVYRRAFPLNDAETLLRETNAELSSFYRMYPQAQRGAALTNPGVAALEAQGKSLRTAIYNALDRPGQGAAAKELNRRYGALLEIEGEATARMNVAARQQPESLSEQIGAVRAAADMARGAWRLAHGDVTGAADIAAAHAGRAAATAIKEAQTTDALIRRAFAGYTAAPAPIVMPSPSPIAGLLPSGSIPLGPGADPSGGRLVDAARTVVRDPRTGRMKRMYTGEARTPPSGTQTK